MSTATTEQVNSATFETKFYECFNRAALGNAAQLPELLRETRAVGLSDDDVRRHLEESQVSLSTGSVDGNGYLVWRSCNNRLYITCESWEPQVRVASVNELFTEQDRANSRVIYQPQAGHLSLKLLDLGEELTELESCILDAAQTLNKKFQHGTAINRRPLGRVVMQYHPQLADYDELKAAYRTLDAKGICRIENAQIRLVKFVDQKLNEDESRFARIVEDERLIEILAACNACCGIAFDTGRNLSARAAVMSLVKARHGISKGVFNERIRQLVDIGALEEVDSKGSTAFRLTIEASDQLNAKGDEFD